MSIINTTMLHEVTSIRKIKYKLKKSKTNVLYFVINHKNGKSTQIMLFSDKVLNIINEETK